MISKKIMKRVKRIEIKTRGLVNDLFGGEYQSAFKGRGMTFSEVRKYYPGDDIRLIDWNVTARTGSPFIKVFEEERELTVFLMVDISSSGTFGTIKHLKKDFGAEIASVLGFSAIKNNDKVALILFSDKIEKYLVPKKGKKHILRVIRELLYTNPDSPRTSIKEACEYLLKVAKRRSVVFLISDFLDKDYSSTLKIINKKHDLIAIQLLDPAELKFPNIGLIKVEDPETRDTFWIDTTSKKIMSRLKDEMNKKQFEFIKNTKKNGIDLISIPTEEDFVEPLLSFFKRRDKRI